jgi:hypothetical protein
MFMVPRASSGGWRAGFDLVHESGGYSAWHGGNERQTTRWWRYVPVSPFQDKLQEYC